MQRDYTSGNVDNVIFFTGKEVEHTPAFGLETLFVVDVQDVQEIQDWLDDSTARSKQIKHIFFGANHSFKPTCAKDYDQWEQMITHFLDLKYLCSLDIPLDVAEEFLDSGLCEYNNFIPQIRVPLPYISLWNYNTMIKLDDRGFNQTNPGVWSHRLHSLKDPKCFTSWEQYLQDEIIK